MPSQKNIAALEAFEKKLANAKSVIFTKYNGLSLKEQTSLRAEVRSADAELLVVKNTLLRRALKTDKLDAALHGQTAVVLAYGDEIAGLKKVVEFAKKTEKPEVVAGWMQDRVLSAAEVKELAKLPGKIELIGQLIARLQGPAYGLVNVLQGTTRNLVYAVEAIRKQKENAPSAQ